MLVLGIDPGTATTGYGLLETNGVAAPKLVKFGWIKTEKNGDTGRRLVLIYSEFLKLLKQYSPDVVAVERLFFFSNAKTVIQVGQAQGVFLLAASQRNIPVSWYPPGQVKLVVTGTGRADKTLMKQTIRSLFKIRAPNKKKTHFDDAADAVAIALCHIKLVMSDK